VRARRIAAFLAATVIVCASAIPAAAAAKPHRLHQAASVDAEIHGKGTGGFEFALFTLENRGDILWVSNEPSADSEETAVYFVLPHRGRTDFKANVLHARIGRLGTFSGRFKAVSTETEAPGDGCAGESSSTEKGFFVGHFVFRGERGYTTVQSRRERGTVTRQGATSCPAPAPPKHQRHRPSRQNGSQREREANKFRLLAGDTKTSLRFQAEREESPEPEEGSLTTFQASVTERVGGLQISRDASTFGFGPDTATVFQTPNLAEPLVEATLASMAPFSGSATFHLDTPKSASWTGDLAVELPGLGQVPLTGDGIEAGLCKGRSHCTRTLPEPLQKALELRAGDISIAGVRDVELQTIR
jgi:hypothetical protein